MAEPTGGADGATAGVGIDTATPASAACGEMLTAALDTAGDSAPAMAPEEDGGGAGSCSGGPVSGTGTFARAGAPAAGGRSAGWRIDSCAPPGPNSAGSTNSSAT